MAMAFRRLSAPVSVHWEVTPACNKRCVHCYNHWRDAGTGLAAGPQPFDDDAATAIVDDLLANRVLHVIVTGGEPLLVLDGFLPHAARLVAGGTSVSLNSNLMGLTPEAARRLLAAGVRSVLASLPASTPARDRAITGSAASWQRTVAGIRTAVDAGLSVGVNMVVSKLNLDDIRATAALAAGLGVRRFSATRAMRPGNASEADFAPLRLSPEEFRRLPSELASAAAATGLTVSSIEGYPLCATEDASLRDEVRFNRVCRAGKTFLALDMDRVARPCILLEESYTGDLATVWEAMGGFLDVEGLLPAECVKCPSRGTCGGGCKAEALHERGSYAALDPYAEPSRAESTRLSPPAPASLDGGSRFRFFPGIRRRTEGFGGILFRNTSAMVPADEALFAFHDRHREGTFSVGELARDLGGTQEEAMATASHLISQHLVEVLA